MPKKNRTQTTADEPSKRRTIDIPDELKDLVLTKARAVFRISSIKRLRNTGIRENAAARQAATAALFQASQQAKKGEKFSLKSLGEAVGIKSINAVSLTIRNAEKLKGEAKAKLDAVLAVLPATKKAGRPRNKIPPTPPPPTFPSGAPETLPSTTPTPYAISSAVLNSEIMLGELFSEHLESSIKLARHVGIFLLWEVRLKKKSAKSEKNPTYQVEEESMVEVSEVHEAIGHIKARLEEGDGWLANVLDDLRRVLSLTN